MTVSDIRMSETINRSSTNLGSGAMSAITMAITPSGTAISPIESHGRDSIHLGCGGARALAGVMTLPVSGRQPPMHQLEDVGEDFGHRAVQVRRNFLADFDGLIERLRQRRVLDDGNLVFHGALADAQGQIVLA